MPLQKLVVNMKKLVVNIPEKRWYIYCDAREAKLFHQIRTRETQNIRLCMHNKNMARIKKTLTRIHDVLHKTNHDIFI